MRGAARDHAIDVLGGEDVDGLPGSVEHAGSAAGPQLTLLPLPYALLEDI